MAVIVSLGQVLQLAPKAIAVYRDAFAGGQTFLDASEISRTPLRVAHFMAQILHESGAFTIQYENLSYSAERLPVVWPSRFRPKGPLDPSDYARNPQRLANVVYGGRMGNDAPDDGYAYRGRGLLQLTGKNSYREATTLLRGKYPDAPDFVATPDAVLSVDWCLAVAAVEWQAKGCNALADQDDIEAITRRINGGLIGLAERNSWAKRCKPLWH